MVPPEIASELPPLDIVTVPPQLFEDGVAAVFFILVEGYVSVKATPLIAVVLVFRMVMVIFEAPFIGMTLGLKPFVAMGDVTTVSVSEAAEPVPALVVDIAPVLFVYVPATVAVTGTTMEQ